MTKIALLIYDDQDTSLGQYFQRVAASAESILALTQTNNLIKLNSNNCNFYATRTFLQQNKPYFVGIFSHGNATSCIKKNTRTGDVTFLDETHGNELSGNFVYSIACDTGRTLGRILNQEHQVNFWGYNDSIGIYTDWMQHFVECDLTGLRHLVQQKTPAEAINDTKDFFNKKIDFISEHNPLAAAELRKTRDSLVFFGDLNSILF